jgi:ribosome biogenesis GTPase
MREGLLIKAYGGFYYVRAEGRTWELSARGRLRRVVPAKAVASATRPQAGARRARPGEHPGAPVVGDRVLFTLLEDGSGTLESIMPRNNVLLRPHVANVDQVLLVASLAQPEPDLKLTDRILVCCQSERLQALICFNKVDLINREDAEKVLSIYAAAGYQVCATSALRGIGLEAISRAVEGKVSVMAGPSGAGKSTIINALNPFLAQGTGEISRRLGRGRHTTRHVELLPVAGGFIADTPGFSKLDLPPLDRADLAQYFPEFDNLPGKCRFLNCLHFNEPDCAVKQALEKGLITTSRYRNYLSFLAEVLTKERTYS